MILILSVAHKFEISLCLLCHVFIDQIWISDEGQVSHLIVFWAFIVNIKVIFLQF